MTNNNYENLPKEELIKEIERLKKELKNKKKYGLVWEEKPEEVIEMCKHKLPILKEDKEKEIITDKEKPINLLIEGDNYHALSVLNYTHNKKVDVIYIDPPYNTGNKDFIFNDRYVDPEDAYRHSKWLSFMEKRLKLAKNLLKDTGVIFISIDDNEVAQLKLLMDDKNRGMFGENNFIANLIWKSKSGGASDSKFFAVDHEYVLVYAKNSKNFKIGLDTEAVVSTIYNLKDEKGEYALDRLDKQSLGYLPSLDFPIIGPDGKEYRVEHKNPKHKVARWRWSKDTVAERYNELVFKWPYVYTKNYKKDGVVPRSILIDERFGRTRTGKTDLFSFFNRELFSNPKPAKLIKYFIKIIPNKDVLVLDFMAGSGTTAQAVLELNKEDGGNRKFILCTNNENNNGNGYKIAEDICYPRIKKVIEGYKNLKGENVEGLGGNLKYFKTDFADAEPTDKNKLKLTEQATEMLCIKEGTFESVIDNEKFKLFKNSNHYTGIIWDQTAIPEFKKKIKDIKGKLSIYVFSLGDETFDDEFSDIKQKVQLSPIPEAILRVYRRIFK